MKKILAALLTVCLALSCAAYAQEEFFEDEFIEEEFFDDESAGDEFIDDGVYQQGEWLTFLLMCNEGMLNDGGDVGNTLMVISMHPGSGTVKQLMFTWDTFIDYPGYELPQLLDHPFRVGGPEETMRLFNEVFQQNIQSFLSINYMNLSTLIDAYGGVTVDVTRAERNALNGMVASKKEYAKSALSSLNLDDNMFDALLDSYSLVEFGPDTQLTGMQAVAFGWLQYDSVYNCCVREVKVISQLFSKVSHLVQQQAAFHMDGDPAPEPDGRRLINIDHMAEEDIDFLYEILSPIFEKSYNNLTREQIEDLSVTIVRAAYIAQWMGVDLFETIDFQVLPLENGEPYETVAGVEGHIIDYPANILALNHFLYGEDVSPLLQEAA